MDHSLKPEASTEPPNQKSASNFLRWKTAGSLRLGPEQRFLLALFLFMDVIILSFGCLMLSGKIALPF